jgi:hypothetical protein
MSPFGLLVVIFFVFLFVFGASYARTGTVIIVCMTFVTISFVHCVLPYPLFAEPVGYGTEHTYFQVLYFNLSNFQKAF